MSSKVGQMVFWFVAIVGGGVAISKYVTPTEEQLYNKLAPDLQKKVDEIRAQSSRNLETQQRYSKLKEAAEANQTLWTDSSNTNNSPPPRR